MHTSTTSTVPLEPWTAVQLAEATQGYWLNEKVPQGAIKRILTDSRFAEKGDAFLALQGERFDAHDFVAQVAGNGCEIAIVSHPVDADIYQLVVADTRLALGHLGAYRRVQNSQLKVIALTGSIATGKSTVARQFAMLGAALYDADKIVHDLLGPKGLAVAKVASIFPEAHVKDHIDRKKLGEAVFGKPETGKKRRK